MSKCGSTARGLLRFKRDEIKAATDIVQVDLTYSKCLSRSQTPFAWIGATRDLYQWMTIRVLSENEARKKNQSEQHTTVNGRLVRSVMLKIFEVSGGGNLDMRS